MLKNYKELKVWQKSYQSCLEIYRITRGFPKEERYGLTSPFSDGVGDFKILPFARGGGVLVKYSQNLPSPLLAKEGIL
jgi:hypothetical protein